MRKLTKGEKPPILDAKEVEWTQEYLDAKAAKQKNMPSRWRHSEIKSAVAAETADRCAYCDDNPKSVYPGDVEHLLPKSQFPHLVLKWSNLTFACWQCNNKKREYYSATLPLIDPYVDDPDEHLLFFGDLVLPRPGSERGIVTIHHLGLARKPLVEERRNRIEHIVGLVQAWSKMPNAESAQAILEIIIENYENGPFKATVRSLLREMGILDFEDKLNKILVSEV
ncbi:HNH endonuclease [Nocardia noduli]|uniref:HNH endonuclease n=1 Tax=Nocardia noduli TaxID=2815722 RepID=UPI001C218DCB|nr:HNH endonuclease [Nocardia noduli]